MKIIKRLRPQVKLVLLVIIATVCGLVASYIYNESTTNVHVYTMNSPSEAGDFIEATRIQL